MRDRLIHRGPDSGGEYVDRRAALGVRRLRVIDLVTGDQPQANEDGTVWTVFNGEIYNFEELRDELTGRGHRFKTLSDTEVIVHSYEEYGISFVERLEGMFAIAVWDLSRQRLVLARDRLGKKPLLYAEQHGALLFASEHEALIAGLGSTPGPDHTAIALYLRLGYVPAPYDAFQGVRKLRPAHTLVWENGHLLEAPYWRPPAAGTSDISEQEAIEELRRLLTRAVKRRLIADVPIGAFLSGGVDSSAVVATMAQESAKVRTFSIGFGDPMYSELHHARRIAQRFATEHHEFVVEPMSLDEILPDLVRRYGEPYADSSAVPTYYLSRLTRQHVTVALNGDGGDEILGGYERYYAAVLASRLDRIPAVIRRPTFRALSALLPDSVSPLDRFRRARRFLSAAALPAAQRYMRWLSVFEPEQVREMVAAADLTSESALQMILAERDGFSPEDALGSSQRLDLLLYLPEDLLVKVDIASMANSLEVRCPFLDRELVEFALRLPADLKIRARERKYILKRAFDGIIPPQNMYRRKQGFAVPIGGWFRGDLKAYVEGVLLSERSLDRGLFRQDAVRALVHSHTSGRADHTHRVWALLMLELWFREFIDN